MLSKNLIKRIHSLEKKKFRDAERLFVAEGQKLVDELTGVFPCVYMGATSDWMAQHQDLLKEKEKWIETFDEISYEELRRISFQETPQQVLAVFRQPHWGVDVGQVVKENLCLALDDIQNPGNLGTIVRLADWFGIEHIFCSRGSADIYNPKTVQATMGAMARVQVHYVDLPAMLSSIDSSVPVYGTFLDGENFYKKELKNRGVIIMGNEGKGVSKEVEHFVTERLYIPNYPAGRVTSESLNVAIATAIVCAEFRRR